MSRPVTSDAHALVRRPKPRMIVTSRAAAGASRGFGLVEMIVAIGLLSAIVILVFSSFFRARDELGRISNLVNSRQAARATIQLIERDVRMAGSCFAKMPINASNNGTPMTYYAINPGPGGGACDSVQLVGAWGASAKITATVGTATTNIVVDNLPTNGFNVNDLILLTNGSVGHMFQITGINNGTKTISHANTSAWNVVPGSWNWPPGGYATGAQVYKVDILSYSVDSTAYRRPALVRRTYGSTAQVVSYDVNKFQLWYRLQDGSLTRTPPSGGNNGALIDKVRPVVFTSLTDATRATFNDSVWSEVRPRTF